MLPAINVSDASMMAFARRASSAAGRFVDRRRRAFDPDMSD